MDICKTDMQKIIKYLDDAAKVYDTLPGTQHVPGMGYQTTYKKVTKEIIHY